jgi:hypothetical protein
MSAWPRAGRRGVRRGGIVPLRDEYSIRTVRTRGTVNSLMGGPPSGRDENQHGRTRGNHEPTNPGEVPDDVRRDDANTRIPSSPSVRLTVRVVHVQTQGETEEEVRSRHILIRVDDQRAVHRDPSVCSRGFEEDEIAIDDIPERNRRPLEKQLQSSEIDGGHLGTRRCVKRSHDLVSLPLDPGSFRREDQTDSHGIICIGSRLVPRTVVGEYRLANQYDRPWLEPEPGERHDGSQNENKPRSTGQDEPVPIPHIHDTPRGPMNISRARPIGSSHQSFTSATRSRC